MPVAVAGTYSYAVPEGLAVAPGDIVAVPLGTRDVIGVVWDDPPDAEIGHNRLRPIAGRFDAPPLAKELRAFVDWIADYTLTTRGMVLRMVLRAPGALEPEPPIAGVRLAGPPPERMTPARQRVLDAGSRGLAWSKSGPCRRGRRLPRRRRRAGRGRHARGRVDAAGAGGADARHRLMRCRRSTTSRRRRRERCARRWQAGGFSVTLLDGVTGSGKTEVYFEAVAAALRPGRQVLILIPEIALTTGFLERFSDRFGGAAGRMAFRGDAAACANGSGGGVADGSVRAVVGARSALFLPFAELGLIVVDEEHDLAYKQEDRVFYNARDMAVVRGHLAGFPVVLSSATPSIEMPRQCRCRPLPTDRAARPLRAARAARHRGDRHARAPARARPLPVAAAGRGGRRDAGRAASRRCSSSTAAAMRR